MMDAYPDSFTLLQIHASSDGYGTPWGDARMNFYNAGGYPTTWFDGVIEFSGTWEDVDLQYAWYEEEYLARQPVPTDVTIDLYADPIGGNTYQVQANVCVEPGGTPKTMRVHIAQVLDYWPPTEGDYSRNGFKQATESRDITVAPGTCRAAQGVITLDADSLANLDDVTIVAWAQEPYDTGPAEVHQAAIAKDWPLPELNLPACCLPNADCVSLSDVDCLAYDGEPQGPGSSCHTSVCEPLDVPACCMPNTDCVVASHGYCVALDGDPQGPGSDCDTTHCRPMKWSQPPTYNPESPEPDCFWGWDEPSIYGVHGGAYIVADDWECTDTRPITDIHWWGSYPGWADEQPPPIAEGAPDSFHIGIWTDVAAGVDQVYSHPGTMIWEWIVPRSELNERSVGCDYHPEHIGPDTCFKYDFVIADPATWFFQDPAGGSTIYWISIAARYPTALLEHSWGWKTRRPEWNDDAVRIFDPVAPTVAPPSEYVVGEPIENLEGSWDMAFVLTSECPDADPPVAESPPVAKNRYISFVPGNPGQETALRVTLAYLPEPFEGYEGCQLWVRDPSPITEASGSDAGTPPPTFMGATLGTEPDCRDWGAIGLIDVYDDEIVPGAIYEIQAVDCTCSLYYGDSFSEPLPVPTSELWGDAVGAVSVVDFNDITSLVDKFRNLPGAPRKARSDLSGDLPDRKVDFGDISYVVEAFKGEPYPFDGPDECP